MASSETTLSILVQLKDQASKELTGVAGKLQALQPQLKQIAVISGAAFAGLTAAIGYSVKAAAEAEAKLASMDATLATMGGNMSDVRSQIIAASQSFVQLGFDDETAAQSMALLYQRTGDVSMSLKLTAAAADLARAKHIDLESATKLVSLALSGQGRALALYGIAVKDINSPLELLGALQSKVGGQASAFAETLEGKLLALKLTTDNLREAIGGAFIPVLKKMLDTITPIIVSVTKFIDGHKTLTAAVLGSATAVSGIVFALASVGLILPKVVAGFNLLRNAILLAKLSATELIATFAVATVAVGAVVAIVNWLQKESTELIPKMDAVNSTTGKMGETMAKSVDGIKAASGAFADLAKEAEDTRKKIADVEKNVTDLVKTNSSQQQTYKENLAQTFVDQEQKVKDLTTQIQDEKNKQLSVDQTAADIEKLSNLETQLATEQAALDRMSLYKKGIELEYVEMVRRSQLTEFELKIENLMRTRVAELKAYVEKLQGFVDEEKALKEHLSNLSAQQAAYTEDVKKNQDAQVAAVISATAQINASMSSRSTMGGTTTISAYGMSLPGLPATGIRNIKDAIITPGGDVINTDPADYLIATKTPGAMGGGGVTVNVYGDVTGEELIERVKQGLMRSLRLDTKFAI